MKLFYAPAVFTLVILMTSGLALAQSTDTQSDGLVSTTADIERPATKTTPTKQYRSSYDQRLEGINHDIDSSVGIEPDMDGAAGKFGAESSGGLRGGVQLQNDR